MAPRMFAKILMMSASLSFPGATSIMDLIAFTFYGFDTKEKISSHMLVLTIAS
jgi:hypothetical protein